MKTQNSLRWLIGLCVFAASSIVLAGCGDAGKVGGEPVPKVTPPPGGLKVPPLIPPATPKPIMFPEIVSKSTLKSTKKI